MGDLRQLITLDMYNNQMYGAVPASVQNLTSLQYLYLDNQHYKPLRQKYCGQRMNPRLGKYSWRAIREQYHEMMSTHCPDDEIFSTEHTFNSLPDQDWEY